uniref:Uncharacterized protein n=1 Tax=Cacopsylla melanoneura TaxID=428564 RepID=A0A8D9FAN5_9HEMI
MLVLKVNQVFKERQSVQRLVQLLPNDMLIDPPIDPSAMNNVPFQLEELNSHECPSLFETYEYSSESDSDNDSDIVKQKLANWAVEHQIQNKALSALLVILNVHNFFSNFPRMLEHY